MLVEKSNHAPFPRLTVVNTAVHNILIDPIVVSNSCLQQLFINETKYFYQKTLERASFSDKRFFFICTEREKLSLRDGFWPTFTEYCTTTYSVYGDLQLKNTFWNFFLIFWNWNEVRYYKPQVSLICNFSILICVCLSYKTRSLLNKNRYDIKWSWFSKKK